MRFLASLEVRWLPRVCELPLLENVYEVLLRYVAVFLVLLLIFEFLSQLLDAGH